MRILRLVASGMALAVLLSCAPKELTRPKAKELIAEKMRSEAVEYGVQLGSFRVGGATTKEEYSRTPDGKYLDALEEQKAVTVVWHEPVSAPWGKEGSLTVTPSADASKFVLRNGSPMSAVAACYAKVKEVTGIHSQDSSAVVEFTVTHGRTTPFGEALRKTNPGGFGEICGKEEKRTVEFARFDDGWRIQ